MIDGAITRGGRRDYPRNFSMTSGVNEYHCFLLSCVDHADHLNEKGMAENLQVLCDEIEYEPSDQYYEHKDGSFNR